MKHYAGKLRNYAFEGKDPMDIPKNHIKTVVKKFPSINQILDLNSALW